MGITINFYLNNDKRSKNKEKAIFCYIRQKYKTIVINTDERIEPKYWDKKAQKVKKSYVGSPELNHFLVSFRENILKKIRQIKIDKPSFTWEDLAKEFKSESDNEFFDVLDSYMKLKEPLLQYNTFKKINTMKNHLLGFQDKYGKITFNSIDLSFFDRFENYLLTEKKLANNTINKNFQILKTFLSFAYERGYTKNNNYQNHKSIKITSTDMIALTMNDIKKLLSVELDQISHKKARDLFLFLIYTGQRYSDVAKFDIEDVKNGIWFLKQQKTQKSLEIPLAQPALQLLKDNDYKLPKLSNQKFNVYIKEVCKIAGLDDKVKVSKQKGGLIVEETYPKYELVSPHTGRRTFVSLASYMGLNQQVVKSITGHTTDKMVGKYFKKDTHEGSVH